MKVDFSELKLVIRQMEFQAQVKECPYCERQMKTSTTKNYIEGEIEVSFSCNNCGYKEEETVKIND